VPSADLQGGRWGRARAAAGGGVAAWGKGTEHRHDRAARRARTEADGGAEAVQQLVGADGGADGGVEAAHGGGWRRTEADGGVEPWRQRTEADAVCRMLLGACPTASAVCRWRGGVDGRWVGGPCSIDGPDELPQSLYSLDSEER